MLQGQAALAMWWDMSPDMRPEFEHWHTHEHFPERLAQPGFRRATRWADADGGEGFFILYELAGYEALTSPEYLARLNAPSDWSRKLMPHHRNMVRSQARVLETRGGSVAGHALTVRISPRDLQDQPLRNALQALIADLPMQQGFVGAHLLKTDTPAIAATTEQKIRGNADRAADWIFIVMAYERAQLQGLANGALSDEALQNAGATAGSVHGQYVLRASMTGTDAS